MDNYHPCSEELLDLLDLTDATFYTNTYLSTCCRDVLKCITEFMLQPDYLVDHVTGQIQTWLNLAVKGKRRQNRALIQQARNLLASLDWLLGCRVRAKLCRDIIAFTHNSQRTATLPLKDDEIHFHSRKDKLYFWFLESTATLGQGFQSQTDNSGQPRRHLWLYKLPPSRQADVKTQNLRKAELLEIAPILPKRELSQNDKIQHLQFGTYLAIRYFFLHELPEFRGSSFFINIQECEFKACVQPKSQRTSPPTLQRWRFYCHTKRQVEYTFSQEKPGQACPFKCGCDVTFNVFHSLNPVGKNRDSYLEDRVGHTYHTRFETDIPYIRYTCRTCDATHFPISKSYINCTPNHLNVGYWFGPDSTPNPDHFNHQSTAEYEQW